MRKAPKQVIHEIEGLELYMIKRSQCIGNQSIPVSF